GCPVDVRGTLHTERDVMDTAPRTTMQAEQVMFGRSATEIYGICVVCNGLQPPNFSIEASVRFKIGRKQTDVTDVRQPEAHDFAVPPLCNAGQGSRFSARLRRHAIFVCDPPDRSYRPRTKW